MYDAVALRSTDQSNKNGVHLVVPVEKKLTDILKYLVPLGPRKRSILQEMGKHLSDSEKANLKYLTKLRKAGFHKEEFGGGPLPIVAWHQVTVATEEERWLEFAKRINRKVADGIKLEAFTGFSKDAVNSIKAVLAKHIVGLEAAKEAATIQLFSNDALHVLLLGDPGTGKTDILRSIEKVAEKNVFGLGSGTSKAGLLGSYEGGKFVPGVLVLADEGVALIDELNLLKKEDRAGLYSAMEKGFITYDKRGKHERFNARVRILATANPKGDKFVGKEAQFLRAQLPFDDALLSRFHLVVLIRKPNEKELEEITRQIVRKSKDTLTEKEAMFIKEYVAYAEKLEVSFDGKYESMVVDFIDTLKADEKKFLMEVGPRTVLGVIRLAKAYARARLARHTSADDLERAMALVKKTVYQIG